jgi:hypothetical protein
MKKLDIWQGRYQAEVNKSYARKMEDMANDMNQQYSRLTAHKDLEWTEKTLEENFKEFLSIVFEKWHDNRFCGLTINDDNVLVLSIDADSVIGNARQIDFALLVFLEEWYPELDFSHILLEWT